MNIINKIKNFLESEESNSFVFKSKNIGGDNCILCYPKHININWNKHNLFFRSLIFREKDCLPISCGFFKFFNFDEHQDIIPKPSKINNCSVIEKLDGSLLIISKFNNEIIVRTRGTFDATQMTNGEEIDILKNKYPKAFEFEGETATSTRLFEWCSPSNRIIIKHNEVDMKLIGIVDHKDYSLATQKELDLIANHWKFKRPQRFLFNSIEEMTEVIKSFKDKEGVCLYYDNDQTIKKLKSTEYLLKHRLKDDLGSITKLVDFYLLQDEYGYSKFYNTIVKTFDYETAEECKKDCVKVCESMKKVQQNLCYMINFINDNVRNLENRKDQALEIKKFYHESNNISLLFKILDNREITKSDLKKMIMDILDFNYL